MNEAKNKLLSLLSCKKDTKNGWPQRARDFCLNFNMVITISHQIQQKEAILEVTVVAIVVVILINTPLKMKKKYFQKNYSMKGNFLSSLPTIHLSYHIFFLPMKTTTVVTRHQMKLLT